MKTFKNNKKMISSESGFIALLTVVIAAIILTMVMGISSTSVKQLTLASSAKEGSRALFAADTGIDCALYWDVNHPNNTMSYFDPGNTFPQTINCNGAGITIPAPTQITSSYSSIVYHSSKFSLNLGQGCAEIMIFKNYPLDTDRNGSIDLSKEIYTQAESRGYNVPCALVSSNPPPSTLVERGIRSIY